MPRPVVYQKQRLPATYMNFYFVNGALLVPTFGQTRRDARALEILQRLLPSAASSASIAARSSGASARFTA